MTVQHLALIVDNEDVISTLTELYPEEKGREAFYHSVLDRLRTTETISGNITVYIRFIGKDEIVKYPYWDIYAVIDNDKDGIPLALGLTPWNEVAGMHSDLGGCPETDFMARLLWEITFYGDEDQIKKTRDELMATVDRIKADALVNKARNGHAKDR